MASELWRMSVTELAAAIRQKRISSRDVIQAHLARIGAINPTVNAVTVPLAESALAAADRADQQLVNGKAVGPLHGVPMTVKENIDLAGSATTRGVIAFKDLRPAGDAPYIAQLKAAGAIPIGRTNMPSLAFGGIQITPCAAPP